MFPVIDNLRISDSISHDIHLCQGNGFTAFGSPLHKFPLGSNLYRKTRLMEFSIRDMLNEYELELNSGIKLFKHIWIAPTQHATKESLINTLRGNTSLRVHNFFSRIHGILSLQSSCIGLNNEGIDNIIRNRLDDEDIDELTDGGEYDIHEQLDDLYRYMDSEKSRLAWADILEGNSDITVEQNIQVPIGNTWIFLAYNGENNTPTTHDLKILTKDSGDTGSWLAHPNVNIYESGRLCSGVGITDSVKPLEQFKIAIRNIYSTYPNMDLFYNGYREINSFYSLEVDGVEKWRGFLPKNYTAGQDSMDDFYGFGEILINLCQDKLTAITEEQMGKLIIDNPYVFSRDIYAPDRFKENKIQDILFKPAEVVTTNDKMNDLVNTLTGREDPICIPDALKHPYFTEQYHDFKFSTPEDIANSICEAIETLIQGNSMFFDVNIVHEHILWLMFLTIQAKYNQTAHSRVTTAMGAAKYIIALKSYHSMLELQKPAGVSDKTLSLLDMTMRVLLRMFYSTRINNVSSLPEYSSRFDDGVSHFPVAANLTHIDLDKFKLFSDPKFATSYREVKAAYSLAYSVITEQVELTPENETMLTLLGFNVPVLLDPMDHQKLFMSMDNVKNIILHDTFHIPTNRLVDDLTSSEEVQLVDLINRINTILFKPDIRDQALARNYITCFRNILYGLDVRDIRVDSTVITHSNLISKLANEGWKKAPTQPTSLRLDSQQANNIDIETWHRLHNLDIGDTCLVYDVELMAVDSVNYTYYLPIHYEVADETIVLRNSTDCNRIMQFSMLNDECRRRLRRRLAELKNTADIEAVVEQGTQDTERDWELLRTAVSPHFIIDDINYIRVSRNAYYYVIPQRSVNRSLYPCYRIAKRRRGSRRIMNWSNISGNRDLHTNLQYIVNMRVLQVSRGNEGVTSQISDEEQTYLRDAAGPVTYFRGALFLRILNPGNASLYFAPISHEIVSETRVYKQVNPTGNFEIMNFSDLHPSNGRFISDTVHNYTNTYTDSGTILTTINKPVL